MRADQTFHCEGRGDSSRDFLSACRLAAALASGLLCLSACGSAEDARTALSSLHTKAHKAHPAALANRSGEEDVRDMVSAVNTNRAASPVQVKFSLAQRPELGQVVELHVAVLPGSPGPDRVATNFQATEGLEIVDGGDMDIVDKPSEGVPLRHVLKILPRRDGIFAVTAVVSMDIDHQTTTRTFSIPLIAGAGLPELAGKPEVTKGL
jgi:hypothetical protein